MLGRKDDGSKLRYDLIPPEVEEALAEILTVGAEKYEDNNWKHVEKAQDRYYAALRRHMNAWRQGERRDPEDDLLHSAHALACVAFLVWFDLQTEDGISNVREWERMRDNALNTFGDN